jgi:hypothetical protein
MRIVDVHMERLQQAFAEKAAKAFAENPKLRTFTEGDIEPGVPLAIRWGMDDRSVVVVRLDENHEPVIYGQLVPDPANYDDVPF